MDISSIAKRPETAWDEVGRPSPIDGVGGALLRRPRHAVPSEALWHVPFLFWAAEVAAPRRVVQLGVGDGVTYFALCQAVSAPANDAGHAECVGVDRWPEADDRPGGIPASIAAHNEAHHPGVSRLSRMDPLDEAGRVAAQSVDALVIGASLEDEAAAALARAWRPKLSPHGMVIVEAAARRARSEAGRSLLAEARDGRSSIHLEGGEGLLVALCGEAHPAALRALAGSPPADRAATCALLTRLGAALFHEATSEARGEALTGSAASLDEANREVGRLSAALARSRGAASTLEAKSRQAAVAAAALFDARGEIEALRLDAAAARDACSQRDAEVDRLGRSLAATASEIEGWRQRAEALARTVAERDAEIARLQGALRDQDATHAAQTAALEEVSEALVERAREAEHRSQRLADRLAIRGSRITALKRQLDDAARTLDEARSERAGIADRDEALRRVAGILRGWRLSAAVGRRPDGSAALPRLRSQIAALRSSELFDAAWYREVGVPGGLGRWSAEEHYARLGTFEGLDPGPSFSTMDYYHAHPDVAEAGYPALVHYLMHGRAEGRLLAARPRDEAP